MVQPRFVLTISMMSIFMTILSHQMQSPEDVQKFCKIYKNTPVPDSLFNEPAGLQPTTLLKKRI